MDEKVPPDEPKLDASDEPKLEASGDDATQITADAEPASVTAQDDDGVDTGGMELTGAGTVLLGTSPLGML